jgi:riboflavin synthase
MFTGIIEKMGIARGMTRKGEDARLEVETGLDMKDVRVGDSISVNGACLTVVALTGRGFAADVSAETLSRTNLRTLKAGDRLNLEKSLRLNDFLGGHIVLGHVDSLGKIFEKKTKANSIVFGVEVDEGLVRYIVEKGSVAVDGISLTVNECKRNRFYVNIIPHTARETTLGFKKAGDAVNIETDILGKYVEKLLQHDQGREAGEPGKGLDLKFLAEQGYIK